MVVITYHGLLHHLLPRWLFKQSIQLVQIKKADFNFEIKINQVNNLEPPFRHTNIVPRTV